MLRKIAIATAVPLALVCGSAWAMSFDKIDKNNDDRISKDEFLESEVFDRWDNNNDGKLDRNEIGFDWSNVSDFDEDNDGQISQEEFRVYVWSDWDVDENAHLDMFEWDDAGDKGWLDV